ncbi:MAG TPA: DUF6273 domain-containing protein [Chloroflexia bacterium]|nr:DUF6273 domain-containing protein [Chloroflexia bacterium]
MVTTMLNSNLDDDRDVHHDPRASAPHPSANPGEIITFGTYPQTADGTDTTPVRWRVLQNSGGELFILSEFILDCKRYHREYVDTTWRDCDLRKWLNEEFYNAAFTAAAQELVKATLCTDNGEGSPDTEDRVFLLSTAEARTLTNIAGKDVFDRERRAVGTEFARVRKADGCRLYVYDMSVSADYLTVNGKKHGCSWWWLRTQPGSPSRAAFVGARGSIRGYARVNRTGYGVRPALTLRLAG